MTGGTDFGGTIMVGDVYFGLLLLHVGDPKAQEESDDYNGSINK